MKNDRDFFVITGASSGIGRALAIKLAECQKKVLAIARTSQALTELKKLNPEYINIICADVATPQGREAITDFFSTDRKIAALIHNAAVMRPSGYLESIDLSAWRYQMAVNVEAPLFLTKNLLPFLQNGRILNLTIYSSFNVTPGLGAYAVSKSALNTLTQYFQAELKKYNILTASVLPGLVDTNIQDSLPLDSDLAISEKVKKLKKEGKLLSPFVVSAFLRWLILDVTDERFSHKIWDIYDQNHHAEWGGL